MSASVKRPGCSMCCTLITPMAAVPAMIGTPRYDLAGVPTTGMPSSSNASCRLSSNGTRVCRILDVSPSPKRSDGFSPRSPFSL